jgi:large subunit ribosomal protein L21
MYAIIQEGGGQRLVRKDDVLLFDLIQEGNAAKGNVVTYDKVLVVGDGKSVARIGAPLVDGASVTVEVIEPVVKGEKIFIHKYRRRKGYRRKTGHRQTYTKVRITAING